MSFKSEFARVVEQGWLPHFEEAAKEYGQPTEVYLGIASRETNMGGKELRPGVFQWLTVPGDGGNGFGLMQADRRSHPEWVKTGEWKDPRKSILMGAKALQTKLRSIKLRAGDSDDVTDSRTKRVYKYIIPRVPEAEMLRCALAMYNSGDWALYHKSRSRDYDHGTTGGDYAQDVLNRAKIFKGMLAKHRQAELLKAPIAPPPPSDPGEPIKSLKDEAAETAAMPGFKELGAGFLKAAFGGMRRIFTWVAGVFTGSETGMGPQLIAVLVVIGLVVAFGVYVYRKRRKAKEVK